MGSFRFFSRIFGGAEALSGVPIRTLGVPEHPKVIQIHTLGGCITPPPPCRRGLRNGELKFWTPVDQARSQTGALGAIAPSVGLISFAPSEGGWVQRVQSEAPEGAMRTKEGAIAPSAPAWLGACSVNFEVEYFLKKETEGVLTDTVIYFSDQHLTWLSQLKPNVKVG